MVSLYVELEVIVIVLKFLFILQNILKEHYIFYICILFR